MPEQAPTEEVSPLIETDFAVSELEPVTQTPMEPEDEAVDVSVEVMLEPSAEQVMTTAEANTPSRVADFTPIESEDPTSSALFEGEPQDTSASSVNGADDPLPQENASDAEPPPVSEELPPDFWDSEPVETAPTESASEPKRTEPTPPTRFDEDAPVLEQLQSLFPGRITRIDPLEPDEPDTSAELEDDDAIQESLFD